jgi:hypothetical protein
MCPVCPRGAQRGAKGRLETGPRGPWGRFLANPEYNGLTTHLLLEAALDLHKQRLGALGDGVGAVAERHRQAVQGEEGQGGVRDLRHRRSILPPGRGVGVWFGRSSARRSTSRHAQAEARAEGEDRGRVGPQRRRSGDLGRRGGR